MITTYLAILTTAAAWLATASYFVYLLRRLCRRSKAYVLQCWHYNELVKKGFQKHCPKQRAVRLYLVSINHKQ